MWKSQFDGVILARGSTLCENIVQFDIVKNQIYATVEGNEMYNVEIDLNLSIDTAVCTCPYRRKGQLCKHIAAVMYRYERSVNQASEKAIENDVLTYVNALDDLSARNLLTELIDKFHINKQFVLKSLDYRMGKVTLNSLKLIVDSIENQIVSLDDIDEDDIYNDHYEGDYYGDDNLEYFEDLHQFQKDVLMLINNGKVEEAYNGSLYFFDMVSKILNRESFYPSHELFRVCEDLLKNLNACVTELEKSVLFEAIYQILLRDSENKIGLGLISTWDDMFNKPTYSKLRIQYATKQLRRKYLYKSDDYISRWVKVLLNTYKIIDKKDSKRLEIIDTYWDNDEIPYYYITELFEDEMYPIIIKKMSEKSKRYGYQYHKKLMIILKDSYRFVGMDEDYKKVLYTLLIEELSDLGIFNEYKSAFTEEEWNRIARETLRNVVYISYRTEIYKQENMLEELMKAIISNRGLELLVHYQKILLGHFDDRILDKYKMEIYKMGEYAGGRSYYKTMAYFLNCMREVEGGNLLMIEIITTLNEKYKKRNAMIQELNKIL